MATPGDSDLDTVKSRRPKNTAFKQQRLPAWQPILTAKTVLPAFFAIGLLFIPLGIAFLVTSDAVQEEKVDYTNCNRTGSTDNETCSDFINRTNGTQPCECDVDITLKQDFKKPVFMYYGLTNFYQNHRRYVKSRDDNQLQGQLLKVEDLNSDCRPYRSDNDTEITLPSGEKKQVYGSPYAPCGAIANSMFNDTLTLHYQPNGTTDAEVPLLKTGIAWSSDKNVKFRNPTVPVGEELKDVLKDYVKPPSWSKPIQDLDIDPTNNGFQNEDLIVWMRTAALPHFRKFYRRIDHKDTFANGLPKGTYKIRVIYAYPVTYFQGRKSVILTTTSWLGGKNPFLGYAYLVVGSICIVMGIVFTVIHVKYGKKTKDVINVTNRTTY